MTSAIIYRSIVAVIKPDRTNPNGDQRDALLSLYPPHQQPLLPMTGSAMQYTCSTAARTNASGRAV